MDFLCKTRSKLNKTSNKKKKIANGAPPEKRLTFPTKIKIINSYQNKQGDGRTVSNSRFRNPFPIKTRTHLFYLHSLPSYC